MSSALYLFSTFFYQVLNLHPFPFVQQYVLSFFSSLLFSFPSSLTAIFLFSSISSIGF